MVDLQNMLKRFKTRFLFMVLEVLFNNDEFVDSLSFKWFVLLKALLLDQDLAQRIWRSLPFQWFYILDLLDELWVWRNIFLILNFFLWVEQPIKWSVVLVVCISCFYLGQSYSQENESGKHYDDWCPDRSEESVPLIGCVYRIKDTITVHIIS
jgi:hypothetical protein